MTAPITPDERATLRALADVATEGSWDYYRPHHASGYHEITRGQETLACQVSGWEAEFIAAARTAVPRLLDALDTAEAETVRLRAERRCSDMEVYAETWNAGYENAMAQGLADDPALADDWLVEHDERVRRAAEAERDEARAEVARLRDAFARVPSIEGTYLVDEVDGCTCGAGPGSGTSLHEPGCGTEPRVDLRALDGWDTLVASLRTEATVSPAWDEDAVREAGALALTDVYERYGDNYLPDEEEMVDAVLAVVREHLPVTPDQETIARAVLDALDGCVDYETQYLLADAVLALWPGESRAQVQAEALRDAADAAVAQDNTQGDWWDDDGQTYGTPIEWLRARADRLAAEGGAS